MIANILCLFALAILVAAAFVAPSKLAIVLMLVAAVVILVWLANRIAKEPRPEERDAAWQAFLLRSGPRSPEEDR